MSSDEETLESALDRWTFEDWQEYRRRVGNGEGCVKAMDAVMRRRACPTEAAGPGF